MSDEVNKLLWENLNEAIHDARHYLSLKDFDRYREAIRLIELTTSVLNISQEAGEAPKDGGA